MSATVLARSIAIAGALLAVTTLLSAQAPAHEGVPELLAEVRALRTDVNQAAGASMRMQLLLARLTLQEQRIAAVGRDIADVQGQLLGAARERTELQARLRQVEDIRRTGTLPPEDLQGFAQEAKTLSARIADHATREQALGAREAELLASLTAEQGRWMEFNARLDDLERSLPAGR